jgi:hypothetical protein
VEGSIVGGASGEGGEPACLLRELCGAVLTVEEVCAAAAAVTVTAPAATTAGAATAAGDVAAAGAGAETGGGDACAAGAAFGAPRIARS